MVMTRNDKMMRDKMEEKSEQCRINGTWNIEVAAMLTSTQWLAYLPFVIIYLNFTGCRTSSLFYIDSISVIAMPTWQIIKCKEEVQQQSQKTGIQDTQEALQSIRSPHVVVEDQMNDQRTNMDKRQYIHSLITK